MSRQQVRQVTPPLETDKKLSDFSSVVQSNLEDLYEYAHIHRIRTAAPSDTEGQVGDIYLVNLSGTFYLYVKFPAPDGWKRATFS